MRVSYKTLYLQEQTIRKNAESRAASLEREIVALAASEAIIKRDQVIMDDLNAMNIFIANGGSLSVNGECKAVTIHCLGGVLNLGKGFSVGSLETN